MQIKLWGAWAEVMETPHFWSVRAPPGLPHQHACLPHPDLQGPSPGLSTGRGQPGGSLSNGLKFRPPLTVGIPSSRHHWA